MLDQLRITPAVKNILIINALAFAATYVFSNSFGIDLHQWFGLHYCGSDSFYAWQFVTYMFMHAGFTHLFFNMFSVYMFGRLIEQYWGIQRFLIFYFVTGIGAGIIQELTYFYQTQSLISDFDAYLNEQTDVAFYAYIAPHFNSNLQSWYENIVNTNGLPDAVQAVRASIPELQNIVINSFNTVGASGACFGILLAFGMMFPNITIMLLFPPIPIKAKYFVLIYGLIELLEGVHNFSYDNVAHWAHLGGMLFGFFLIRKWQKEGQI